MKFSNYLDILLNSSFMMKVKANLLTLWSLQMNSYELTRTR
jgi:hypothetical protein